jgi:hypothetical protein
MDEKTATAGQASADAAGWAEEERSCGVPTRYEAAVRAAGAIMRSAEAAHATAQERVRRARATQRATRGFMDERARLLAILAETCGVPAAGQASAAD